MRIACVGYRNWANRIYDALESYGEHEYLRIRDKSKYDEETIRAFHPDIILFYGWSWLVPECLLRDFTCFMLHPSPLPRYRGGSPLQNQIIAGEKSSEVCIFIMTPRMDDGDIVARAPFSLEGTLEDIFERIIKLGIMKTRDILINGMNPAPQDHRAATHCKRRSPRESEITLEELKTQSAEYLYNKVRMLADPYPNAFLRTKDGKRLLLKVVEIAE